jgi:predicted NBD/HSP70 family sugar kinase
MTHLGLDIGGTSVKAAIVRQNDRGDGDGTWIWTGQSNFYHHPNAERIHEAIGEAIAGVAPDVPASVTRVGLCVPGLLDPAGRTIAAAINVPGLVGISLDELVAEALGTRPAIRIVNDAAAAADDLFVSDRLAGRLLVLALGTGVGACVLDDGKPLNVTEDSPGHLGQIDVSIEGEPVIGPDGGAGGLEGYIGGPALSARFGENVAAAISRWTGHEAPIRALARAIRICHAIYRPGHVRLCGGIGIRLRHLLHPLRQQIDDHLTRLARPNWTLDCGQNDFHAARGAARLAAILSQSPLRL